MKIKLDAPYKSITKLDEIELPNFVILTGINGSGKTQILQGISTKKISLEIDGNRVSNIKLLYNGLGDLFTNTFYGSKLERYCVALQNKINTYNYNRSAYHQGGYVAQSFETFFSIDEQRVINSLLQSRKNKSVDKNLEIGYVDRLEIMKHIPPGYVISDTDKPTASIDVFQFDLSQIFKLYQIKRDDNDFKCYLRDIKGRSELEALSDAEFLEKHGEAPWILANEILASSGLGYTVTTPENQTRDDPFTAKLISSLTGEEINFSDLSSGEKVLMGLSLAFYNSHFERTYPEVLLLDEPDCHLHPTMAGTLLKVIEDVFVKRRNVRVIMTTHSPSTVALATEDCLYVVTREGARLAKGTKERCIKTLTSGIPTLSIDYDNRLQVFVESKYDAKNYGSIYEILKGRLENEISLNFISSGTGGSGSCDQVRETVNLLRRNGNGKIFGVVDWDGKNQESEFVKVVANGNRYSLENLIFDPLLLGVYLIRESHLSVDVIGLGADLSYVTLGRLQGSDYEKIAAYVVDQIEKILGIEGEAKVESVNYVGGFSLAIKSWYLLRNGHELEGFIKETFKPLMRFRNENDLKSDIIKKVMADFPQFIPNEFVELFALIQNQHLH